MQPVRRRRALSLPSLSVWRLLCWVLMPCCAPPLTRAARAMYRRLERRLVIAVLVREAVALDLALGQLVAHEDALWGYAWVGG